ncbi:MAG: formyltetrahydrofolate deformylase [Cyclobacteriaceae bacterium]|nr:MAG: formyltetrahydrofolate deformylase [Cyclobacteriaceae bacterium]
MSENTHQAIILISCADQSGIISMVTNFISSHGGNIMDLDEHVDYNDQVFFMRVAWELSGFTIPDHQIEGVFQSEIADRYAMDWSLHFTSYTPRMAIFVSKFSHCLYDILGRYQSGDWRVKIPVIISNHEKLKEVANRFDIPFRYFPITPENKGEQELKQLAVLQELNVDFVVLARYMQILTTNLIQAYPNQIINIHHSFLPAFPGARPYHSAHARGVKIIGASSHYVTEELDAGPIIDQDVVHISHKDDIPQLIRKGKDLEKIVLSRAVFNHLERKVLVYQNRTIIFD